MICKVMGCGRAVQAKSLCMMHYKRVQINGDVGSPGPKQLTANGRFVSKYVILHNGCWLWLDHKNAKGYGTFYFGKKKAYAHRYAYELLIGPIQAEMTIDHLCLNTSCVNPEHMEVVSRAENTRRARAKKNP